MGDRHYIERWMWG